MNESIAQLCDVCGLEVADARNIQQCFTCDRWFHLNPRQDIEGIDCGDAWLGASLGVEYFCQICIDEQQAEALSAHGGDAARLAQHQVMQMVTPGAMLPPAPPRRSEARPPADAASPPPKPVRTPKRRRYRRLDG